MSSAGGPGSLGAGGGSHDGSSGAAGMEASCRVHSYGNMKVPLTTAGDAGHNSSCPNILQGQVGLTNICSKAEQHQSDCWLFGAAVMPVVDDAYPCGLCQSAAAADA